jgi:hypothetical protein
VTGITNQRRLVKLFEPKGRPNHLGLCSANLPVGRLDSIRCPSPAADGPTQIRTVSKKSLLAGRCLGFINDVFLKLFHFGIGAERFSHRRVS